MTSAWWCEFAWLGGDVVATDVLLEVDEGRIVSLDAGVIDAPPGANRLDGLTVPAFANAHSHAFHRALRGRTHAEAGDFWTWRDQMYAVAGRLDPDSYHELARATFAEMALAGIAVVGEFHYVHHRRDGSPYGDADAMTEAVVAAATDVGVRLTLLETLYLHGGFGAADDGPYCPITSAQVRFRDESVEAFLARVAEFRSAGRVRLGLAIHSVRAVDPESMAVLARWAEEEDLPLHVHVSEQLAENDDCRRVHGCSPVALLDRTGLLRATTTLVHATHVSADDIALIAASGAGCCFCPTTERDLADGIGPSRSLADAGVDISLGTDSHASIDLFEETRALAHHERLASRKRGGHTVAALLTMATAAGYRALGWGDGGELRIGAVADFTTVGFDSVRLAGSGPESMLASAVFAATAADVSHTVIDGRLVAADGRHHTIDVPRLLETSIRKVTT